MMTKIMRIIPASCRAAAFLIATLVTAPTFAGSHPVMLWQAEGARNQIYLLGSIHLLRQSDYPIPSVIYDAYNKADALIMELDIDDMDPMETQSLVLELGMIRDGGTLADILGPGDYAKASRLAGELQIPLAMLDASKPWLAAVTVETLMLTRVGFDPSRGIEMHLSGMANNDGKNVTGFETTREQLQMLDGLSVSAQRKMLLQTLEDGGELESMLDEIIDAWRQGDLEYMEDTLLSDMAESRELYQAIVVDRNRNWVRQIDALLDDDENYLVIVGTMHLIGNDGVPELLRQRGMQIQQLQQGAP